MDKFLTPERKSYYMNDFQNKVLVYHEDFWKLDDGLPDLLIRINANPKIQTLYSQKYSSGKMTNTGTSYLQFTYTEEIEGKLFKEQLPQIMSSFNYDEDIQCYYSFEYPQKESDCDEVKIQLGCVKDPDYFDINVIDLHFRCFDPNEHNRFWEDITERLSSL